jgi:hypothetical protein
MRLAAVCWLALVFLVHGSTEMPEVELLDGALNQEMSLLQLGGPSSGTEELKMELEGMVDSAGKPIFVENSTDTQEGVLPQKADSADSVSNDDQGQAGTIEMSSADSSPPKYTQIDYLSFQDDATEESAPTMDACERSCSSDQKCKSFTYNKQTKKCFVSKSHMQYDMEFEFMVKHAPLMGGEPELKAVGPLKYTASAMEKTASHLSVSSKVCQNKCATDTTCFSMAYRTRDQLCLTSKVKIEYNPDVTYYEKEGVAEEQTSPKPVSTEEDEDEDSFGPGGAPPAPPHNSVEMKKEIQEKASLTSEQSRFIALAAKHGAGDPREQALQNAILSVNVELKAKQKNRIAAANARVEAANRAAQVKKAAEAAFKSVEQKTLKESNEKLKEMMEGESKSEEKAAEASAKASAKAAESAAKEKLRLKHSGHCEKNQKNHEAADLKTASLVTRKTDSCSNAALRKREVVTAKTDLEAADQKVQKVIKDDTRADRDIVSISLKTAVRNTEEQNQKIEKQLLDVTNRNKETAKDISDIKEKQAELDQRVGAAQNKKLKAESHQHAANLAVQAASTGSEVTMAKASQAGAASDLAKAETELSAAEAASKAAQADLSEVMQKSFKDSALQQRLEQQLADGKVQLKSDQDKYLSDLSEAKLRKAVASHQRPLAQASQKKLGEELQAKEKSEKEAVEGCEERTQEVAWNMQLVKKYQDIQVTCTAERTEKASVKAKAVEKFKAEKAAFDLKMAKRREADFIKLMAGAKLQVDTAPTMEAKANAGSKLADMQAEKMESQQEVSRMIPKAQAAEVSEAKASAKEEAAVAEVARDEKVVQEDEKQVARDEAKKKAISPNNPDVIIGKAKELLANLREIVGKAEVAAGEEDTTNQDEDSENKSKGAPRSDATKASGNAPTGSTGKDLERAAKALKSGNKTEALDAIAQAELDAAKRNASNPAHHHSDAKMIIQQVTKEAKEQMYSTATKQAEQALATQQALAQAKEKKEQATKAEMKQIEEQMKDAKKEEKVKAERAKNIAGQWPFSGDASDVVGKYGAATLEEVTWEKDDTYGKCLSFQGKESEANLGNLEFTKGTISLWVRVNEALTQQLFAPTVEAPILSAETVQQETAKAIEESVQDMVKKSEKPELGEGNQFTRPAAGRGRVTIQADGSVSVYDGEKDLALASKGTVSPGTWIQLAFAFTKSHVTMYTNGALQYTVECEHDFNGNPFIIGGGLQGAILNVDFWQRTLQRLEISKLPKPASEADQEKFVAHSPEGEYELAKSREKDLLTREQAEKDKMRAAEKTVKTTQKSKQDREIRMKNEMKAEKERRDEIALKDKANEAAQKDKQKETEAKENKSKASEDSEKESAKAEEKFQKDARKEAMAKEAKKQQLDEQQAAKERAAKQQQRQAQLDDMKAQENAEKEKEKASKESATKEVDQKNQELAKATQDETNRAKASEAANKENAQKHQQTLASESSNKAAANQAQASQENQQKNALKAIQSP